MIKLLRNNDKADVLAFMVSDAVWATFKCDKSVKENYDINIDDLWLNIYVDNEFSGMARLNNYNLNTIAFHPYMVKNKAKSRDLVKEVFKLFLKTPEFVNKLIATIPFDRKIVYNLAKRTGFRDEGVNRSSVLKGGVFYDQWNVGITKDEIKALI